MTYQVIDVTTGNSHGHYDTIGRAYGCIEFNLLHDWEIWDNQETCIEWSNHPSMHVATVAL